MKYRSEIDGLRALAVLPVILFHAGFEWFSGGFVGVCGEGRAAEFCVLDVACLFSLAIRRLAWSIFRLARDNARECDRAERRMSIQSEVRPPSGCCDQDIAEGRLYGTTGGRFTSPSCWSGIAT